MPKGLKQVPGALSLIDPVRMSARNLSIALCDHDLIKKLGALQACLCLPPQNFSLLFNSYLTAKTIHHDAQIDYLLVLLRGHCAGTR